MEISLSFQALDPVGHMGEVGSAAKAKLSARPVFIVQLDHGRVLSPRSHFDKRKRLKAGGLLILAASFQPAVIQRKSSGHATHGMPSAQGHGFGPKLFRNGSGGLGAWGARHPGVFERRQDPGMGSAGLGVPSAHPPPMCHGEPTLSASTPAVTHACRKDTLNPSLSLFWVRY